MSIYSQLGDIPIENEDSGPATFNKRLLKIIRKERLQDGRFRLHPSCKHLTDFSIATPTLLSDINLRMEAWGTEGKINPFQDIYDLVIQMTVRMASCRELAADPEAVKRMADFYWMLERSATPVGLLLPWFPGPAKKNKMIATKGLYEMLSQYVEVRRKAEVSNSDAIDSLIADGAETTIIVEVRTAMVFNVALLMFRFKVCDSCYFCWCRQHGHDQ